MKTKVLLASLTLSAAEYLQKTVNTKNRVDYQKLKKLYNNQCFEAKNFDDTKLDILTFDWQSLERDRNWWWQLQALPFLSWYANSFELQSEEERIHNFSLCLDAIHCWMKHAKQNKKSPLAWHDHAAAFRVRNLVNWLVFCQATGLPVDEEVRFESLANLVIEHLDWLQEDKHYSKHTNHGFDQAMIALTIGLMFANKDFDAYRERNRERLKNEVSYAFTDEGVHKENSPGYQKMMLERLKQLRTLAPLREQDIPQMGERYIEKAETFLRAITLPNGYLPMIGDTRGKDVGLPYKHKEKVDVLDYSKSGYLIVRGTDGENKEFFILLKNTHESNYHRHDDDMMIYLFYDGVVVLGDGGLYKHEEQDEKRKHLRSHWAHSVPYIDGEPIRNCQKIIKKPVINRLNKFSCQMKSFMFGLEVCRDIKITLEPCLKLDINDFAKEKAVRMNFFFTKEHLFSSYDGGIKFHSENFDIDIGLPHSASVSLHKGWLPCGSSGGAIISHSYGLYEKALSFSVAAENASLTLINKP